MSEPAAAESGRVRLGVASVALGAVGFGLLPVFLEYLRADGVDSGSSLVARFVGAAIPLALWVFIRRPAWRGVGLALVAGVGIGGGTIFLFEGYARLPASIAILVFYTYPVFTLALARAVFGTPIERRMLAAIAMVVLAAGLILSPGSIEPGLLPVVLATFGAPLGYGVYLACLGRIPAAVDPALRALVLTMSAGVVAGLYALAVEGGLTWPVSAMGWASLGYMTFVTGVAGIVLIAIGAALAGSGRAAVAGSSELVTVLIVGWWVFGEAVRVQAVAGAALMFAAIAVSLPPGAPGPRGSSPGPS